jgi:subtilisin family serine protease
MSLGGAGTTQTLTDAVDYAARKGVVLVAAAGNSGSAELTYPAAYPDVLSVAGTTESGALYGWSNYGSWVQVAAPGCNTAPWNDGGYVNFCGTSSATPVVAGIAGLVLSSRPDLGGAAVEQAIRDSAVGLGAAVRYGRVDARGALAALGSVAPAPGQTTSATPAPEPAPTTAPAPATPAPTAPPLLPGRTTSPAAPAAPPFHTVYRGILTRASKKRTYTHVVPGGELTAELAFSGTSRLTVSLLDARGRKVAGASGTSPLRVSRAVGPGRYRVVVSSTGTARPRFTLTLTGGRS